MKTIDQSVYDRTANAVLFASPALRVGQPGEIVENLIGDVPVNVTYAEVVHLLRAAKALRRMEEVFGRWEAQTGNQEEALAFARQVIADLDRRA